MNQDIRTVCDMLTGNINRMMVTDDQNELFQMYAHACLNSSRIFEARRQEIRQAYKDDDCFDSDNREVKFSEAFEDNLYRMDEIITCLTNAGINAHTAMKALETAKPYLTYDEDLEEYTFSE